MRTIDVTQAIQKCMLCKHGSWRPHEYGKRVAYDVEAIKCEEGIFGLPHPLRGYGRHKGPSLLPPEYTHWLWVGALSRHDSKQLQAILKCPFWQIKTLPQIEKIVPLIKLKPCWRTSHAW